MEHKRHSSYGRSKVSASDRVITGLVIVLSIALIAGILVFSPIGKVLMDDVIDPLLSCDHNTEDAEIVSTLKEQEKQTPIPTAQNEIDHKTVTIDETQFFILQMGAYQDVDAANQRAHELKRMGAGGVVMQENSIYRVFAAAYLNEDHLMKVQKQVRSDGFEATPYITEKNSLKITLEGNKQAVDAVKSAAQLLDHVPVKLCDISLSYDKNELTADDVLNELLDLCTSCKTVVKELDNIQSDEIQSIKMLFEKYRENISTFLNEHDTINIDMLSSDIKELQLSVLSNYILFFESK